MSGDRFRAVVVAAVPEAATLGDAEWQDVESIVSRALASRPAAVRRQIALFLLLLEVTALARYGRRLSRLAVEERWRFLDSLSKSRLLLVRRGIWGLRTLAFMGYYARPDAAREIGYRAAAAGWRGRRMPGSAP